MGTLLRLVRRLRRDRLDAQLAEEIRLHIELRTQALIDSGWNPEDAAREAHRMFGNATAIREEARDMWGLGAAETWLQDVRYGGRLLRQAPWFSSVAVLSLAVGIGAAAAVFNVADAVLFRELAIHDPDRLHSLRAELRLGGGGKVFNGVGDEAFAKMPHDAGFAHIIGLRTSDEVAIAGTASAPGLVRAEFVSDNYFTVLGIRTLAGRTLAATDTAAGAVPVVLSERTWTRAFARDPAIVGRPLTLNGSPAVVVGVARGFTGLVADRPADLFAPLAAGSAIDPGLADLQIRLLFKLAPDVSVVRAESQLRALLLGSGPSMLRDGELHLALMNASRGLADSRVPLTRPLWLGLGLVGALLLVTCANTAGLLVARFASRQREFGVRIAIGAGRSRLIRQLTIEALMVAALASCLALCVAWIASPLLLRSVPIGAVAPAFELRFDWRLIAFTVTISSAAALLAAAASWTCLLRTNLSTLLAAGSRTVLPGRRSLANVLIAAQVACSMALLAGAGAMAHTLVNLGHVNPGFDSHRTLAFSVDASHQRLDGNAAHDYYSRLQAQVAAVPLVERVSLVQIGLMTGGATSGTADVTGFVPSADADRWVRMFFVGSDFFETTGMRVTVGDSLQPRHVSGRERVAVVNERFARFYFDTPERAVGAVVNRDVHIIGVVADARYDTLRDEVVRAMFVPFTHAPPRRQMTFIVRPADSAGPSLVAGGVTAAVRAFDPLIHVTVTTGADRLASTMARERFAAILAGVLSVLAVFLCCIGLYAMVAHAVSGRRQELALRLALGATRRDIVALVVRDPLRTTAAGVAIGLPCAYALMHGLSSLLFGVEPFDVVTVGGAAALLLGVGVVAGIPAALRAAAIDPREILQ